ncbi:hypothetical protein V5799_012183 [Amblyomma americanum]|uniref:DDE Tnp4 domain-containing protein n=1 Tax=Amblyomma americanum TaxID=6943 RepID=A0AAQ4EEY1_AMBAM
MPYGGTALSSDQRVFNYRLSRARRVAENAFGILANRFRCLHTVIEARPDSDVPVVFAACALHNFLSNDKQVSPEQPVEDTDGHTFFGLQQASCGRPSAFSAAVRERTSSYFKDRGAVPWQQDAAYLNSHLNR